MKNESIRKVINADKPNYAPIWTFKQEDDAVLKLSLVKNSVPLSLVGQTIKLGALRADKTLVELEDQSSFVINNNELDITLKNNILSIPGKVECDLTLTDASGKMTTASFFIEVKKKTTGLSNILGTNLIEGLEKLKNDFKSTGDKLISAFSKEYDSLKRIIIDENQAANLQDQVNQTNAQLEHKTNETRTNNIQAQINNLVLHSGGDSNLEVVQARIDSYGNINTTLKENIDNIDRRSNEGLYCGFIKSWSVGTINEVGNDAESLIRLRTDYQSFPNDIEVPIRIQEGFKYKFVYYDENKHYINSSAWSTESIMKKFGKGFYRFILSKSDDGNITLNDSINFDIIYNKETTLLKKINENKKYINEVIGELTNIGEFIYGNIHIDDSIVTGNKNRASIVKVPLKKGDSIGFINGLSSKYKFSIDICGDNKNDWILSKDGVYHFESYIVNESNDYNFMVAKISNTDISEIELQEINNNFGVLSIKNKVNNVESVLKELAIKVNDKSPLYGKIIVGLGDSFLDANTQGLGNDLLSKIAEGKNMTIHNYGLSSSSLAYDSKQTVLSVMDRYQQMLNEVPIAHYVIIIVGHNDSNPSLHGGEAIPIGENSDDINTTFKGALNILIKALLDNYPEAGILFLTPFNRRGTELPYVEAMKEICGLYSQVVYDNYHSSGICFQNDTHLGIYDQGNLHLNGLGNEKMAKKYIPILETL